MDQFRSASNIRFTQPNNEQLQISSSQNKLFKYEQKMNESFDETNIKNQFRIKAITSNSLRKKLLQVKQPQNASLSVKILDLRNAMRYRQRVNITGEVLESPLYDSFEKIKVSYFLQDPQPIKIQDRSSKYKRTKYIEKIIKPYYESMQLTKDCHEIAKQMQGEKQNLLKMYPLELELNDDDSKNLQNEIKIIKSNNELYNKISSYNQTHEMKKQHKNFHAYKINYRK